ncbi:MAG: stage II sporulation protein P, partial [Clostridia bacterium]|nr:stage II sporulation protein P [Clostridia bacterium]
MQTNTIETSPVIFKDFPPALPPANDIPSPQSKRRISAIIIIKALCLAVAISVISLLGVKKASEILSVGIINYVSCEILGISSDTIGTNVSDIAFGTYQKNEIEKNDAHESMPLQGVRYVPLEDIKNEILLKEKLAASALEDLYAYSADALPSGANPIVPTDASAASMLVLKNDTDYTVDMSEIAEKASLSPPVQISGEPLVLIVHTHGTESYALDGLTSYPKQYGFRTEDTAQNVVAVGQCFTQALNDQGINALH